MKKEEALNNALMQIEKQYGKGSIMRLGDHAEKIGISVADVTTGDYFVTEVDTLKKLLDEGIITKEEFDLKKRMLLNI